MIFEVCIDSIESGIAAQNGGADRVEVCSNLVEGGTTPSFGLLQELRKKLDIRINVMIRPRGGDFLYSEDEIGVMMADIQTAKAAGCAGVVFGLLTQDGDVDLEHTRQLAAAARPMSVTFHRAFDMAHSPRQALEALIDLKIDRLLTSGQQASALAGASLIRNLVNQAGGRIIVMAGAGINEDNAGEVVKLTGVEEIHFSLRKEKISEMTFRQNGVFMGKEYCPDEYIQRITDAERVRKLIGNLKKTG